MKDIIGQLFGIIGLVIIVYSFQCKENKRFFIFQGAGSLMFVINFLLIGALPGALYNLTNLVRGVLFSADRQRKWKLVTVEILYILSFVIPLCVTKYGAFDIFIAALPFVTLVIMSVFMWIGNGKHIRYFQVAAMSPSWIVHNIFNFSLGGILCESFNMISSVIAVVRYRKTGFDN